jgi:hypothetical protein
MPTSDAIDRLYKSIEKKYTFSFPLEYRTMGEQGWITARLPMDSTSFAKAGNNYLWLNDMEWYSLNQIAEFRFHRHGEPYLPNLVPFAFTGGGDYWCWQTDHEMRVLACTRDCYDGIIYAPNFASALFRQALDYASEHVGHEVAKGTFPSLKAFLVRWSTDFKLIFPAKWCEILHNLSLRDPYGWRQTLPNGRTVDVFSILPDDERGQIEKAEFNCPDMDKSIRWMCL